MNINKFNAEKYPDPTCYQAMVNICKKDKNESNDKRFRPLVYVCSPYAGDVLHNTKKAREYCRFAYDMGCIPIAPHLHFPQFLDDNNKSEREDGLFMGIVLLSKCKEVWVFGDVISSGMKAEIEKAKKVNTPVRYFTDEFLEVKPQ
jgi:hypothetical protein